MTSTYIVVAERGALRQTPMHRRDPGYDPEVEGQKVRKVVRELQAIGFESYIPVEREKRVRRGETILWEKPVARYVYVQGEAIERAKELPGVARILTSQGRYARVSDKELDRMRKPEKAKPTSELERRFPPGQRVWAKTGPFKGYEGPVLGVREHKQDVKVDVRGGYLTWIPASDLELA